MDLNFISDPGLVPKPRNEIQIENIELGVIPDGTRIQVKLEVTPFTPRDKPNIDISALNPNDEPAGSLSIIETMNRVVSVILHLRGEIVKGTYTIRADLYYDNEKIQHSVTEHLEIL